MASPPGPVLQGKMLLHGARKGGKKDLGCSARGGFRACGSPRHPLCWILEVKPSRGEADGAEMLGMNLTDLGHNRIVFHFASLEHL